MSIRTNAYLGLSALLLASMAACTREASVPGALAGARAACARVASGPAPQVEAAATHEAMAACADAELAYTHHDDRAELLAVLADRKAQLAESLARTEIARNDAETAVAQQRLLVEVRAADSLARALQGQEAAPQTGAAEMQPKAEARPKTAPARK